MTQLAATPLPEEDRLRADLYNFMGLILAGPPDQMLLDQCAVETRRQDQTLGCRE